MDLGTLFIGLICLIIAWVLWTYLPHPLGLVGGLVFGLLGIYFLFLGVTAGQELGTRHHSGILLPFLFVPMLRRRR